MGFALLNPSYEPLDRERVSGRPPCQKMTDDFHNPAVNWYSLHNRDGLARRRMRFARM